MISLLFNILSRFVITFLPRSRHLLISWFQSPSTVILEPKKMKSVTVSTFPPSVCCEVMEPVAMIFVFWILSFKPAFALSSFTLIMRLFSSLLSALRVVSSAYLKLITVIIIAVCIYFWNMCGTKKITRPIVLLVKVLFFDKEKRKINSYFLALSTEKAQNNDHFW